MFYLVYAVFVSWIRKIIIISFAILLISSCLISKIMVRIKISSIYIYIAFIGLKERKQTLSAKRKRHIAFTTCVSFWSIFSSCNGIFTLPCVYCDVIDVDVREYDVFPERQFSNVMLLPFETNV